jgi:hypothetical protein
MRLGQLSDCASTNSAPLDYSTLGRTVGLEDIRDGKFVQG